MIRINLLPKKVTKRKAGLLQHLAVSMLVVLLCLGGVGYLWVSLNNKIGDLQSQISTGEREKERLKDVTKEKQDYEDKITEFKSKLDIITEIQKGRFTPVHLLDELTGVLDESTPVWLTSYSFTGDSLKIDGYSLSNPDLASFVTKLEKTPYYKRVELLFSEKLEKDERVMFRFSLNAQPEEPEKPE
jgi:type IV pilus assembly protein PilN